MGLFDSIADAINTIVTAVKEFFSPSPPSPAQGCPLQKKKAIRGSFEKTEAKCGDKVGLQATATNIADGTTVNFALRQLPGKQGLGTESSPLQGAAVSPAKLKWISKKTFDGWTKPQVDFEVSADGVSKDSDNKFSFFNYSDKASETKTIPCSSGVFGWTGKFDIEFKDGVVLVTVKIKLINRLGAKPANAGDPLPAAGDPVTAADKAAMKADVEGKLSQRWILHREQCQRLSACDCPKDRRCCKFPVKVAVQFVESGEHHTVNLFQGAGRANASNWTRVKTRDNSWAHETGHLLGFYDEYVGGAVGAAPRWSAPNDTHVMSAGLVVPKEYYWDFRDWYKSKTGESWELLSP